MPRVVASRQQRDRGAMLVFVTLVGVGVCTAVTLALVPVLGSLIERQEVRSAADAAALAGVVGGRGASADLAAANGATLTAWSRAGYQVTVTVQIGEHSATARATDEP